MIEFGYKLWSTNPKISQTLIRRKIPQLAFWWKWKATWQFGFWRWATYLPSTLAPYYDVNKREKDKRADLGEEAYHEWLNQPPIQFPLHRPESPIQIYSSSTSSSYVGDGGNDVEVGRDDFLRDTQAMEGMLLDAFQQNELGDDINIDDTLFESLNFASTTPLLELGTSRSTELGTTMLLYKLKVKHGMSNMYFLELLR